MGARPKAKPAVWPPIFQGLCQNHRRAGQERRLFCFLARPDRSDAVIGDPTGSKYSLVPFCLFAYLLICCPRVCDLCHVKHVWPTEASHPYQARPSLLCWPNWPQTQGQSANLDLRGCVFPQLENVGTPLVMDERKSKDKALLSEVQSGVRGPLGGPRVSAFSFEGLRTGQHRGTTTSPSNRRHRCKDDLISEEEARGGETLAAPRGNRSESGVGRVDPGSEPDSRNNSGL